MKRTFIIRADARSDIREILGYLAERRRSASAKFEARLDKLFELISVMPFAFAKVWRNVRATRVKGFRYLIFYVVYKDRIVVIGVVHGSRDSSTWKSRL